MTESPWYTFDNGATIGQAGSEEGVIVRDEEHPVGARITLERSTRVAPFAITCGIYGWMVHTRFFSAESEACSQYDSMKDSLSALLDAAERSIEVDGGNKILMDGVSQFVETYP